jgi:signal peptidase II
MISGFFFVFDQVLKYLARTFPTDKFHLIQNWLGWEYFENPGIAFSLPFPNAALVIATPIILLILVAYIGKKKDLDNNVFLGANLIFFGAISNFTDRILFEVTIDYIRIATSVINIADVMIILGTLILIFPKKAQGIDKTSQT